jgi:hypothetical protein
MGWEKRHGGTYYYRPVRRAGRVEKEYFGNGVAARAAAWLDAEAGRLRRSEAETLRGWRDRLAPLDGAAAALDGACRLMLEATLISAGYHRQNYCEWRRRRVHRRRVG